MSFIVASGWYTGAGFGELRKFLATRTAPVVMVNLPYDVFKAAWVDTTVFIARKRGVRVSWPLSENIPVRIKNFEKREQLSSADDFYAGMFSVNMKDWFTEGSDVFLTRSNVKTLQLTKAIGRRSRPLGEVADVQRGVTPFKLSPSAKHPSLRRAFTGTLRRYRLHLDDLSYVRYDDSLAEWKPERYFRGARILLRELISRQFQLQAAATTEDFITNKSIQTILPNDPEDLYFLFGCINPSLTSWIFLQRSNIAHRDDFPKIVLKETKALPIPEGNRAQRETVGKLAHIVLDVAGSEDLPPRDTLMLGYFEQILNALVYELYFPEDLHNKGLRFFDLLQGDTGIPACDPEVYPDRNVWATVVRGTFERLYDINHPVRRALDDLASLEVVRIIEGRES